MAFSDCNKKSDSSVVNSLLFSTNPIRSCKELASALSRDNFCLPKRIAIGIKFLALSNNSLRYAAVLSTAFAFASFILRFVMFSFSVS